MEPEDKKKSWKMEMCTELRKSPNFHPCSGVIRRDMVSGGVTTPTSINVRDTVSRGIGVEKANFANRKTSSKWKKHLPQWLVTGSGNYR